MIQIRHLVTHPRLSGRRLVITTAKRRHRRREVSVGVEEFVPLKGFRQGQDRRSPSSLSRNRSTWSHPLAQTQIGYVSQWVIAECNFGSDSAKNVFEQHAAHSPVAVLPGARTRPAFILVHGDIEQARQIRNSVEILAAAELSPANRSSSESSRRFFLALSRSIIRAIAWEWELIHMALPKGRKRRASWGRVRANSR